MLKITKHTETSRLTMRELEAIKAESAMLKAELDYLAMMTDTEIGDDSEEDNYVEEV